MNKKLLYSIGVLSLFSSAAFAATYTLESPSKNLKVVLDDGGECLTYSLLADGESLVKPSEISILGAKKTTVSAEKKTSVNKTWKPVWGQFKEIQDKHNEMNLSLDIAGTPANLTVRLFDNGVGFRYELDNYKAADNNEFFLEYNLDASDKYSYGESDHSYKIDVSAAKLNPNAKAESSSKKAKASKSKKKAKADTAPVEASFRMRFPVIVGKENGKFISLLESDLIETEGFGMLKFRYLDDKNIVAGYNTLSNKFSGKVVSPWRVILVEDNSGDFLVSSVADNLATESKIADTSWIKSGKSLWDWRILGAKYDGFTYGIDTKSYKRLIDFASANGIEFFLMDDGWFTKAGGGKMTVEKKLDYDEILAYAKAKNVDLVLYYDRHKGDFGDDTLFAYYEKIGGAGMKYGFMGPDVEFTKNAVRESAKHKLLINFHDGPVPMTGASRTYPNAITREFCHAQQDSRKVFSPSTFLAQAQINAVHGPLDMNNGNFAINDINALKRSKGPKGKNSYHTTVANECARCLIIYTGFACLPDAPEAYAAKADLFEFLKMLPIGKWDESRILQSKLGKYITTARKHDGQWFVSSSANEEGATLKINLDFLDEGKTYDATLYEDAPETDCFKNPEAYQVRKIKVKKGDIIEAKLAKGGGHNMWIR